MNLPDYYFRTRENGATVFRVVVEDRLQRIEMEPLAQVNLKNGEIKPQGKRELSTEDETAIQNWMAQRRDVLDARDIDDILRTVDHLNLTTNWVQKTATKEHLDQVSDVLFLAMHDLRAALVRRQGEE